MNEKFYETLEALSSARTAMANLHNLLGELERTKSALHYEVSTVGNFQRELKDMEEVVTSMLGIRESAMLAAITPNKACSRLPVGGGNLPAEKSYSVGSAPANSG